MASLPEMADTLLMHEDWPPALAVFERAPYRVPTPGWIHVTIVVNDPEIDFDHLVAILDPYPSTKGRIGVPEVVKSLGNLPAHFTPDGVGVGVMFKGETSDLDMAAPQYRISGWRWIRPAIGGAEAPDPLVTWWALLFALSMYARYHPREWLAALDVDSSLVGVMLERAMDRALGALPQLVLSAVLDKAWLLPSTEGGSGPDPFGRGNQ
jgi:hypothetical protein